MDFSIRGIWSWQAGASIYADMHLSEHDFAFDWTVPLTSSEIQVTQLFRPFCDLPNDIGSQLQGVLYTEQIWTIGWNNTCVENLISLELSTNGCGILWLSSHFRATRRQTKWCILFQPKIINTWNWSQSRHKKRLKHCSAPHVPRTSK